MVKFVLGRGNERRVFIRETTGRIHHEQRRALKMHLGLIR